ncbi:hypothetical protein HRW23_34950 [Streptomyces lunaelactis]|uniref:hypothetical protein n=1 Tax=Streptomyces lunaelactis TaxID=1535768 RepID=UPI001585873E|nr:hypothetical protein [Streptomyces lunaelactis]NUK12346.1 hypothetical protein [Streptomyces lunaelactis]NUK35315.1 hypothetical protein [Streptomyces lunaelactis]NUK59858.1 hypothetical protein [Streptomyces lunaelactis]NUK71018.1 hypothetical protein [Streptomyces lunaelactis]NUK82457.1 hypothetical protein [Streptomyces lunaelactis]
MAEALIKTWQLAVLRVRLDVSARVPAVAAELVGYPEGTPRTYESVTLPFTAYGLAAGTDPPVGARVPKELLAAVISFISQDFGKEAALWLRLVPPYGHLGAVPWERTLVPATGRPLIRVPDRLPVAADPGKTWSVAIALSAAPGTSWAAGYLTSFLSALHSAVASGVDAHLFTDQVTHDTVCQLLHREPHVHLHDPQDATSAHRERIERNVPQFRRRGRASSSRADSPLLWADWIASGLDGQAVRALHVVADARFDGTRPLLAVSSDPGVPTDLCAYASADKVQLLADTVGASVLSFGSPPGNPSDIATRLMADGVGLQRAGPTFYSDLQLDPAGYALAQAHAFVAAQPRREPIPRDPSLFAYLQPEHVQDSLRENWPDPEQPDQVWLSGRTAISDSSTSQELVPGALGAAVGEGVADRGYAGAEAVPGWVAASERYMESRAADLVDTAAIPGETPELKQAYDRGMAQALSELRDFVDRRVQES